MSELIEQNSFPLVSHRRVFLQKVDLPEIEKTVAEYFCEHSNARYIDPVPSDATYANFYNDVYWKKHVGRRIRKVGYTVGDALLPEDVEFYRGKAKKRLHHLTELLDHTNITLDGKKILDVGCGLGYLGNLLITEFDANYFGVEASRVGRENASRNGVQILGERMDDIPEQLFDAVVCLHVLEHIPTPDSFVSQIYDFIKPDGYLFLEVPDGFWVGRTHFKHPWSFSRRSLILLLNRAGLRVLRIDNRDTLGYPNRIDTITLVAQKESNPIEDQDGVPPALTYKQYRVIRYGTLYQRARRKLVQFCPESIKLPLRIILRKLRGT